MLSTFISSTIRTSSSFGASPSSLSNSVAKEAARVSSTITRSKTDFLVPAKRSDPDTKAVKGRPDFEDRVFDHWAEKKIRGAEFPGRGITGRNSVNPHCKASPLIV